MVQGRQRMRIRTVVCQQFNAAAAKAARRMSCRNFKAALGRRTRLQRKATQESCVRWSLLQLFEAHGMFGRRACFLGIIHLTEFLWEC